MKKALIFVLLVCIAGSIVSALNATEPYIALIAPVDNTTVRTAQQEFIFSIEAPEDGKTCSLMVDGSEVRNYSDVIRRKSTTFTTGLPAGEYTWNIACTLKDGTILSSEERQEHIAISQNCVEKIYKGSGSYRYVFTLGCLEKSPLMLSEVRPNDWLEFHMKASGRAAGGLGFEERTDYFVIYMLRLSKLNGADYIEFNTDASSAPLKFFVGESVTFPAGDYSLNMSLDKVLLKKATLTVHLNGWDYAAQAGETGTAGTGTTGTGTGTTGTESTGAGTGTTGTGTGTTETGTGTGAETGTTGTGTEKGTTGTTGTGTTVTGTTEENVGKDSTKTIATIVIIAILLAIVIWLAVSSRKKPKGEKKEEKPRKEAKREEKNEERREEKKEEKKGEKPRKDQPKKDRDFERKPEFMIEAGDVGKRKR